MSAQARTRQARPEPGPILDDRDPRRGRWGGRPKASGRGLYAVLIDAAPKHFLVDLIVESRDGSHLDGPVVYHLHDRYRKSVEIIPKVKNNGRVIYSEMNAEGVCTVGAQVWIKDGSWTSLEFDLSTVAKLPRRVLPRPRPARRESRRSHD